MGVLYMIDGFLRLSNLLYSNHVVQCPSEVYTLYYFICDEVCGLNQTDFDFVGFNDPALKSLNQENTTPHLTNKQQHQYHTLASSFSSENLFHLSVAN